MVRQFEADKKVTVAQFDHSLQRRSTEAHLWTHGSLNFEADELQQRKETLDDK